MLSYCRLVGAAVPGDGAHQAPPFIPNEAYLAVMIPAMEVGE